MRWESGERSESRDTTRETPPRARVTASKAFSALLSAMASKRAHALESATKENDDNMCRLALDSATPLPTLVKLAPVAKRVR